MLNQSFEDFELIICDDNSEDDSKDIISEFARRDSRISFWSNDRRLGLFGNYNQCLKRASGKYIKPFAQDDVLSPVALKAMRQVLEDHAGVVLTSCASNLIGGNGEPITNTQAAHPPSSIPRGQPVPGALVIYRSLVPINNFIGEPVRVMFRKYAAGEGFSEKYNHLGDLEYWLRILRLGHYYFLNQELCSFRMHSASQSAANARTMLFAPDVLQLAEVFRLETEAAGFTRDNYIAQCIVQLGGHVAYLDETGELLESEVAEAGYPDQDEQHLNAAFRQLSFHCLRLIGKQKPNESRVQDDYHLAHLVRYRERALRNLLRSRSWRWTRFLREFKRRLRRETAEEKLLEAMELQSNRLIRSLLYLRYLREKILSVRASTSWRITSPLRLLKL